MNRLFFLVLYYCVVSCNGGRILVVVPAPLMSHQMTFQILIKELVNHGHEVVAITAKPAILKKQSHKNLTEIDVHEICVGVAREISRKFNPEDDLYDKMKIRYNMIHNFVAEIVKSTEVQELLNCKSDHFDLIILESFVRPALIFSHFFKAPVISMSSFGMMMGTHFASGSPSHPLLYPIIFRQKIYNLTIVEKIVEVWKHVKQESLFSYFEGVEDEMLRRLFGPGVPTLRELTNNIDMFFINIHPIWSDNLPVPPNVIFLGNMNQKPYEELPEGLKSYLDSSKNGVIYMSLGTNVQPYWLSEEKKIMLMDVFSKLPYDILFKWDEESIQGCPRNVKIVKWVPQSDLLQHPSIKLFITQAGQQSTDDAINAGVPLIALPILGDQFYNSEKYLKHKIGLKLNILTVTRDEFTKAINTVIGDKSYHDNIIRLRSILRDQPQPSLDRAIWWVEYVLRHGGAKHLRSPAANMPWTEYYELKLVCIILSCISTSFVVIIFSLYYLIKIMRRIAKKKIE